MKKLLYSIMIVMGFILGALGASEGLVTPLIFVVVVVSILMLLSNYERATYIVALYALVDFGVRTLISHSILGSLWDELLFLGMVGVWVYKWFVDRKNKPYHWTPLDIPLIAFFTLGVFLVLVNAPDLRIAIEGLRAVIQYMLWYFIIVQLLKSKQGVKNLYILLVLIGIGIGTHGVYQYIIGVEMPASWVDSLEKGLRTRVFSFIGSPNILGSLMTLLLPMAAALVFVEKKIGKKIIFGIGVAIMAACLVFTFSRGAWIGFIVAAGVFVLLKDKRLIIPAFIALLLVVVLVPSVVDRFTYMLSPEYMAKSLQGGRLIRWLIGIEMLKEGPWLGVGLGQFGGAVAMNNDIPGTFYMDNYYLKTAVEMGIVGLLALWFLLYQAVIWTYRTLLELEDAYMVSLVQGALAGMMGVLAHNFFENVFEVPMMVTYFWTIVGMIMYLRATHLQGEEIS